MIITTKMWKIIKKFLKIGRKHRKEVILIVFSTYLIFYIRQVKKMKLFYNKFDKETEKIIQNCPALSNSDSNYFFPFFFAPTANLQIFWLILRQIFTKIKFSEEEKIIFPDGGSSTLQWLHPSSSPPFLENPSINLDENPIMLIFHSLLGKGNDYADLLKLASKKGWRGVVMNRRGHFEPLKNAIFNTVGDSTDSIFVIKHINRRFPKAKILLVGVSAGSALVVRSLGDISLQNINNNLNNNISKIDENNINDENNNNNLNNNNNNRNGDNINNNIDDNENKIKVEIEENKMIIEENNNNITEGEYNNNIGGEYNIIGGVGISPGYLIDPKDPNSIWNKMSKFYEQFCLSSLKSFFIHKNFELFSSSEENSNLLLADQTKKILRSKSISDFHLNIFPFTGHKNFEEYLEKSCPLKVANYISVPVLMINSKDDPICPIDCIQFDMFKKEKAILLLTERGSHICFFQFFGFSSLSNDLILQFGSSLLLSSSSSS